VVISLLCVRAEGLSVASAIYLKLANGVLACEGNSTVVVVSSALQTGKWTTTPCLRGHSREEEERGEAVADIPIRGRAFGRRSSRRRASARSVARERERERGNRGGVRPVDPGRKSGVLRACETHRHFHLHPLFIYLSVYPRFCRSTLLVPNAFF